MSMSQGFADDATVRMAVGERLLDDSAEVAGAVPDWAELTGST